MDVEHTMDVPLQNGKTKLHSYADFYNSHFGIEYLQKIDYNYGNKPEVGGVANEQKKPKRGN